MKSIRLLQLMKTFDIGGVERSTITYSNQIAPQIDYVGIFAAKGMFDHTNIIDERVELYYASGKISNLLIFFVNLLKLFKIINEKRINIVHYHQRIFIPYIYVLRLFKKNIKIIYTHHTVFNDYLTRFLLADRYLAISKVTKKEILKYKKKCNLVLHGVEMPNDVVFRQSKEIKSLGYVGRFHSSKGIETLLNAFNSLIKLNCEINLLLYGEGKLFGEIKKYISSHNLDNNVTIRNPLAEIAEIFTNIDLLIVPSEILEGFGLVVLEAMSYYVPVIVSDMECFEGVVLNGQTGLIYERKNSDDLAKKILLVSSNKALREDLVWNAYNHVKKDFSIDRVLLEYTTILSEVV